mgnify:CR=1 FL=1|jgi:hypothetical protein
MTTLKLYKGVVFDGVNSFPDIPTKATFDAYLAAKQQYSQTVQYNRIGEPILIQKGYDVAISYSYGCIDTGTKKYFIIPDSINVNENGRVYLTYSVDWYTTLKYDSKISFGRSHLIKSTGVNPLTYPQSIQPIDMRVTSGEEIKHLYGPSDHSYSKEMLIYYTKPDESGDVEWAFSPMGASFSTPFTYGLNERDIMSGLFLDVLGVPANNILAVYYVPIAIHDTSSAGFTSTDYEYETGKYKRVYKPFSATTSEYNTHVDLSSPLTTDTTHIGVVTDTYGGVIHTVPYGRTFSSILFTITQTITQCFLEIKMKYSPNLTLNPAQRNAENSSVLYTCERMDYISDAYKNWAFGSKGVEMEERRIQKNKNLVSGIGNSTITGAIGGASGNPIGAVAGIVGGIASAAMSYGIDTYYESKVNVLEDRKYQLAQDTMVAGSFMRDGYLNAIQLEAPASDIARYNDEITNFGADCNLPVSTWVPAVGAYKFADVEVIADVPYSIKQNIKQKMMNGIKIVDVT